MSLEFLGLLVRRGGGPAPSQESGSATGPQSAAQPAKVWSRGGKGACVDAFGSCEREKTRGRITGAGKDCGWREVPVVEWHKTSAAEILLRAGMEVTLDLMYSSG